MIYRENYKKPILNRNSYAYHLQEHKDGMCKKFVIGEGIFTIELEFDKNFNLKATLFQFYHGIELEV